MVKRIINSPESITTMNVENVGKSTFEKKIFSKKIKP